MALAFTKRQKPQNVDDPKVLESKIYVYVILLNLLANSAVIIMSQLSLPSISQNILSCRNLCNGKQIRHFNISEIGKIRCENFILLLLKKYCSPN